MREPETIVPRVPIQPSPPPLLPSRWLAAALLALALPCAAAPADPLADLLRERGLLGAEPAAVMPSLRDAASELVLSAMNFLDVAYRWGGNSVDEGFDCSGFTRHVFATAWGLALPRRSDQQARQAGLQTVARDELKPGDLVFFNTLRRAFSHVGIYVGDGKFIHAPRRGAQVRIESMQSHYWQRRFDGARRAGVVGLEATPATR